MRIVKLRTQGEEKNQTGQRTRGVFPPCAGDVTGGSLGIAALGGTKLLAGATAGIATQ